MRHAFAMLVLAGLAAGSVSGHASQTSPPPRQDVLGYPLTPGRANQLIAALDAMTKYAMSRPDFQSWLVKSMKMTPAEQRADTESDPKAMAILKQHGLSAQDYVVGVPTLRMALMAAEGVPNMTVSPANLAFAKANLAQLKPKMDAADGKSPRK
jgi:hypothetical protein